MHYNQNIIIYILAFLIFVILLKFFDVINFNNIEILSYVFIFYGMSLVYISMGKNETIRLFIGTTIFLTGIVLFLISNFDFIDVSVLITPSFFFIAGAGFLMLYIDNSSNKLHLFLTVILFILGTAVIIKTGSFTIPAFISALFNIAEMYWLIILIALVIILFIGKSNRKLKAK